MRQISEQKEWKFICSEVNQLHRRNASSWARELLFALQILLTLYGKAVEKRKQTFLALIYLKTKKQYLKMA